MTTTTQISDFEHYRQRRQARNRNSRLLRNLPMAQRLAADRAGAEADREQLLAEAVVGLVEAADSFDETRTDCRFGAFAEPHVEAALERHPAPAEIEAAQAQIAAAMASQDRVQELAEFLDCPVEALIGGLMEAVAHDPDIRRHRLRGAA